MHFRNPPFLTKTSLFLLLFSIFSFTSLDAQRFTGTEISPQPAPILEKALTEYQVFQLDIVGLNSYVHSNRFDENLLLTLGDKEWEISLFADDIRSKNYLVNIISDTGKSKLPRDKNITFSGVLKNQPNSTVKLTINDDFIFGLIQDDGEEYFIESANYYSDKYGESAVLLYDVKKVKADPNHVCGVTEVQDFKEKNKPAPTVENSMVAIECNEVELAILTDHLYYLNKGSSVTNVTNRTIGVMNVVNTDYDDDFVERIRFKIVETIIVTSSAQDPLTNSTDANTILDDFTAWGNSTNAGDGFTNDFDLGQFWTSRDITAVDENGNTFSGVIGLAWIGVVCTSSNKYHILEDRAGNSTIGFVLRVLTTHEIGHNFDATHDASGSGFIMAPSVNNTTTWSTASKNSINGQLNAGTCLAPYFKVASVRPTNCGNGNYDLELVVEHDGVGTGINVAADGVNQTFSLMASPQTVVLTGLTANGTVGQTVSVNQISSLTNDCAASATYREPNANCIGVLFEENFNSCNEPNTGGDWTFTSGNISIFSFQFGLNTSPNNYSVGNFDGTCYAYLDDDIFSSSSYTGTASMTSPSVNLSDFGGVSLTFDYNFHKFEGVNPKPNNNSQFEVQVYNGSTWITVLTDTDDDPNCSHTSVWSVTNCISAANINLNSYLNPDFQMKFIYTDGGTGLWTGMIALDNITITATSYTGGCTVSNFYVDNDGDSFGAGAATAYCPGEQPANFVTNNTDCDDGNMNIFPGATEVCDGVDNNCNNQTDEGFDIDADTVADCIDNCPNDPNPGQEDANSNGVGDACECDPTGIPMNLMVNNDPIPDATYRATNQITSTGVAPANSVVDFITQYEVILQVGFCAKATSDFEAKIQDCAAAILEEETPESLALEKNENTKLDIEKFQEPTLRLYPNPANQNTTIELEAMVGKTVSLQVFNAQGNLMETLMQNQMMNVSKEKVQLNTSQLPTGIYSVLLRTGDENIVRRLVVTRGR